MNCAQDHLRIGRHRNRKDGTRRLPSAIFSGAGDTLRVSPDPLPAISTAILHNRPVQFLHSQKQSTYLSVNQ
jgi:hypothetical protein